MLKNINLQLFAEDDDEEIEIVDENPMSNLDEFVNEDVEETPEEVVEVEEFGDEKSEKKPEVSPVIKKETKTEPEKAEYAWGKVKKENTILKAENTKLVGLIETMEQRLSRIENSETERGFETRKQILVQEYIEDGYDPEKASKLADKDLKHEREISQIKTQLEGLSQTTKSKTDLKTEAEQGLLYRQAKAAKVKSEISGETNRILVKMTMEQKRVWEMTKKTAWGKNMSIKEFLEEWE